MRGEGYNFFDRNNATDDEIIEILDLICSVAVSSDRNQVIFMTALISSTEGVDIDVEEMAGIAGVALTARCPEHHDWALAGI
jgi:hypothetical protein